MAQCMNERCDDDDVGDRSLSDILFFFLFFHSIFDPVFCDHQELKLLFSC